MTPQAMFSSEINWMISKSTFRVLEDGTISYFFSGTLPTGMARKIRKQVSEWMRRDRGGEVSYSTDGPTWGINVIMGARASTASTVRFTFNDYRIPASK